MVPDSKTFKFWNNHMEGKRESKVLEKINNVLSHPSDGLWFKRTVKNYSGVKKVLC